MRQVPTFLLMWIKVKMKIEFPCIQIKVNIKNRWNFYSNLEWIFHRKPLPDMETGFPQQDLPYLQLRNFAYIRLLNKPYENEVTLTEQNPRSKCCQHLET